MTKPEAIKTVNKLVYRINKAIRDSDSDSLRECIDIIDFDFNEVRDALPVWKEDCKCKMWSSFIKDYRKKAREALEVF